MTMRKYCFTSLIFNDDNRKYVENQPPPAPTQISNAWKWNRIETSKWVKNYDILFSWQFH